ncbi:hypothetical protein AAH991_37200 [Microbispora sp. ZYX-F-249]|uniref:Secreted protein n=1 Tax=Microbispora maris TaxID=3144104 RepID=A0ABV0B1G2_9ACTN
MKTKQRTTARLALAAAAAAAALNLVAPCPAQASTARNDGRCELTWANSKWSDFVDLTLLCLPAEGADSITFVNIWADDKFRDDLILYFPVSCASTTPYPVTKRIKWSVYAEYLDEDLWDGDEIYARVVVKKTDGRTYTIPSNVVEGRWGKSVDLGFGPPKRETLHC